MYLLTNTYDTVAIYNSTMCTKTQHKMWHSMNTDVHFKSCHPSHTKQKIPFNLARRICTIVEDKELRNRRLIELQTNFTKQGYPETLTQNCIARSNAIPLTEFRKEKVPKSNNNKILALVSTFNPRNLSFFLIIEKHSFYVMPAQKCKKQ